jgi:hypothetical protein
MLSLIVFAIVLATSQAQNAAVIDSKLAQIRADLIAEESKINQLITAIVPYINETAVVLRTQNKTMPAANQQLIFNLCTSLEDLSSILVQLSTLSNYDAYNGSTSCTDVNRRLTDIDFDVRRYGELLWKVAANASRLATQSTALGFYNLAAYWTVIGYYSNGTGIQQRVAKLAASVSGILSEHSNYAVLLWRDICNETLIRTELDAFKRKYCVCGSGVSGSGAGLSTLESNVAVVEKPLIDMQAAVLAAATDALDKANLAATALTGSTAAWLVIHVNRVKTFLTNLVTIADYPAIAWNSVSSCNDLYIRIGFVRFKLVQYEQALVACNTNLTGTCGHEWNINATSVLYTLTAAQSTAVKNLAGRLWMTERLMRNYSGQLTYSAVKMLRIWIDIQAYGDSYCGCSDTTTTKVSGGASTTVSNAATTVITTVAATVTTTVGAATTAAAGTTTTSTTGPPTTTTTTTPTTTVAPTTTPVSYKQCGE